MENLVGVLGLSTRSVSTVEVDGRPARRALLSRCFPTDPDDLWDALTDAQRIPRWFLPVSGDLRPGGTFQFEGNAGGTVQECDRPRRLRVTWVFGEGPPTWVTVTLEPDDGGTRLDLEHVAHVPDELWSRFGPSATGLGWDMALHGLATHLRTGAAVDPAATLAWTASPEGITFLQGSAAAWQAADVAAGTPEHQAVARVERTVAVYTGQADPPDL
jgi:uncharacterized protein YndB with AHSA1/START domain